jgi:uracil-DNA glycosylase family 4
MIGTMSESTQSDALSALAWLVDAGADEAVLDAPVNRFAAKPLPVEPEHQPAATRPRPIPKPQPAPAAAASKPVPLSDHIGQAMEVAKHCNSLEELKAALEAFEGCALKRTAKHTVFADGTPAHHIMFIGEAPGAEEDRQGKPFVGRAGQLLDKMLASIGLDRSTNTYITNVLNWRPPGNRDPSPEEAGTCLPFLRRHIELVAPEIIVLLGATAARHVTGRTEGIMRMRGQWLEYYAAGKMVPVMPTLHPAYLLRQPAHKKLAWRDLQAIEDRVKSLGLLEPASSSH